MQKLFIYVMGASLLLAAACKKSDSSSPSNNTTNNNNNNNNTTQEDVLVPMKIGNSWTYKITNFDEKGNKLDSNTMTIVLTSTTVINNETWYVGTANGVPGDAPTTNRADGNYSYRKGQAALYAKYPANKGDKFVTYNPNAGSTGDNREVLDTKASVTVPKGTFTTYWYSSTHAQLEDYWWYCPKVGMIKSEDIEQRSSDGKDYVKTRMELVDYPLK